MSLIVSAARTTSRRAVQRCSIVLILFLSSSLLTTDGTFSRANAASATGLTAAKQEFKPDFASSTERGVGLRYRHEPTGYYLDLRLKGYRGHEPKKFGANAAFTPAPGISVTYEALNNAVKETIVLEKSSPSSFEFKLTAPGMDASVQNDRIVVSPHGQSPMFTLGEVVAYDAEGTNIPGTLTLTGPGTARLALDEAALSIAIPPIRIDPTIEGTAAQATTGPQARRLFRTEGGKLILFFRQDTPSGSKIAYRVSGDEGVTWAAAVEVADAGPSGDLSVVQSGQDDFHLVYAAGTMDNPRVSFRTLTRQGDDWAPGPERLVSVLPLWWKPAPTLITLSTGTLGQRFAVGFRTKNPSSGSFEYKVSFSEDAGMTWLPASTCAPNTGSGTLAMSGDRLICLTVPLDHFIQWRVWNGQSFGPAADILRDADIQGGIPSTIVTDDGTLHLVSNGWGSVYYARLDPGANTWTEKKYLGKGTYPVITTDGKALFVYAHSPMSSKESQITSYVATDGVNFNSGAPKGGRNFAYVIDHNEKYQFGDGNTDSLFSLSDTLQTVGNRIGTKTVGHRLDAPDKKVAFRFKSPSSFDATSLQVQRTKSAVDASTYRLGLQEAIDSLDGTTTKPSGTWMNETRGPDGVLTSGSFALLSGNAAESGSSLDPDAPSVRTVSVTIPATSLIQGQKYFLVIEPAVDCTSCPTPLYTAATWQEFQAVGADAGAEPNFGVLDYSQGSWRAPAQGDEQVPWFKVGTNTQTIVSQVISASYRYSIMAFQSPGESFLATNTMTSTKARFFLVKTGAPTGQVTATVVDNNGQPQAQAAFSATAGWNEVPLAVLLQQGLRYRVILETDNLDSKNAWTLRTSGDSLVSWDAATSKFTKALDKPGYSDRTLQASDIGVGTVDLWSKQDFWAFNTSAADELLIGDTLPFDFVRLVRQPGSALGEFATTFTYRNTAGTDSPLTMTRNDFGRADGSASFVAPADWAPTTESGKTGYWLKVKAGTGGVGVLVERISAIRQYLSPTVAPRVKDYAPVAWESLGATPTIEFDAFDTVAPAGPSFRTRPNPFSPDGDGVWDETFLGADYGEPVRSTLGILDLAGASVTSTASNGPSIGFVWDGKKAGDTQTAGAYPVTFNAVDVAGNARTDRLWSTIGPGPTITSVTPANLQIGQKFTIAGSGFGTGEGHHSVMFSGKGAYVTSWTATEIVGYAPADLAAGSYDLAVWALGVTSISWPVSIYNYVIPKSGEEVVAGRIVIKMRDGADVTATAVAHGDPQPLKMFSPETEGDLSRWYEVTVTATAETAKILEYASDLQNVEWAEFEGVPKPASHAPNDPFFQSQWALQSSSGVNPGSTNIQRAWDLFEGPVASSLPTSPLPISVALIDSGVAQHEDLDGQVILRKSYLEKKDVPLPDDACVGTEQGSHGTSVAGAIAAKTHNQLGVSGVAWNDGVKISSYQVFGTVTNTVGVKECKWLAEASLASVVYDAVLEHNTQVINLSMARVGSALQHEQAVFTNKALQGKVAVAAAGNNGLSVPVYPAAYDNVLAVGAVRQDGTKWPLSNEGSWVDIFAPGANIMTTAISGANEQQYQPREGTSYSSAFVAGAAAMMKGLPSRPLAADIINAIVATAQGDVTTGHPLHLDVYRAIRETRPRPGQLLDITKGRFVKLSTTNEIYLMDDDPVYGLVLRQTVSSRVLESWGEKAELIRTVSTFGNTRLDREKKAGFRPGSLISPILDARLDVRGPQTLLVTNDPQSRDPFVNAGWVRGQTVDVSGVVSCLGYKVGSVIAVDLTEAQVHGTPSVWTNCSLHPNGTILRRTPTPPPDMQSQRFDHRAWMLDRGELRLVAGTDHGLTETTPRNSSNWGNPVVWNSWGFGGYYWGPDQNYPARDQMGDSDAVIPSSSIDAEILLKMNLAQMGGNLGVRPGRVFSYNGAYWVVTSDGGDFGRGPRRKLVDSNSKPDPLGCFHATEVPRTVTSDIFDLHTATDDWTC
ncbi:MAG: S8 family serine peptidase [Actinomycetota bacterium]